jgi:hypothetical protein
MTTYRAPGVYFEWHGPPPSILPARTDIAAFVGIARRGPLFTPLKVESWAEFTAAFGAHTVQGYLAYAVDGFFANGGRTCYVVRVANPDWASAARLDLFDEAGQRITQLVASSTGTWARMMVASVLLIGQNRINLTLRLPGGEEESWRNLSTLPDDPRYVVRALNRDVTGLPGSFLTSAIAPGNAAGDAGTRLVAGTTLRMERFAGGADGLWTLRPEHFQQALAALAEVSEVSAVAMPDLIPPPYDPPRYPRPLPPDCAILDLPAEASPLPPADPDFPRPFSDVEVRFLIGELTAHCEILKNRVALLAPPLNILEPQDVIAWLRGLNIDSSYAALYFPWLRVQDAGAPGGSLKPVPPVGQAAGVLARVDGRTGPHKPPANELLEGVQDLTRPLNEIEHGLLNDESINVIKAYPGRGIRIAGARTLSSDTNLRYLNVRRLLIMIGRSLLANTAWLVFEPNNPRLWSDTDRVVRGFLERIWEAGMLDGATAAEAFKVICDSTSSPPEETGEGRMITVIEVNPPWPAEFVVVRIGMTENGTEILEG